jgi:hypothetical protein
MPHTFYLVLHVAGLVLLTLSLGGMIAGQQASDEAARVLEEKGYDVSLAVVAFRREMFRRTPGGRPASGNLRH